MKKDSQNSISADKRADRMAVSFTVFLLIITSAVFSVSESHALLVENGGSSLQKSVEVSVLYSDNHQENHENSSEILKSSVEKPLENMEKDRETDAIPVKKKKTVKAVPPEADNSKKVKKTFKKEKKSAPSSVKHSASDKSAADMNNRSAPKTQNKSLSGAGQSGEMSKAAYNLLLSKLSSIKRYPQRARRQGKEGQCVIALNISDSGVVLSGSVNKSSSHLVLDAECERLVSKITGFDTHERQSRNVVLIPVNFHLED